MSDKRLLGAVLMQCLERWRRGFATAKGAAR